MYVKFAERATGVQDCARKPIIGHFSLLSMEHLSPRNVTSRMHAPVNTIVSNYAIRVRNGEVLLTPECSQPVFKVNFGSIGHVIEN